MGGNAGVITTSTDGITWTSRVSGLNGQIRNMKYTTFGFITSTVIPGIGAQYQQYATSTNGITWTSRSITDIPANTDTVALV